MVPATLACLIYGQTLQLTEAMLNRNKKRFPGWRDAKAAGRVTWLTNHDFAMTNASCKHEYTPEAMTSTYTNTVCAQLFRAKPRLINTDILLKSHLSWHALH